MSLSDSNNVSELRSLASQAAEKTYAPYSGMMEGAALLLSDGHWIPGARVENASFSLTLPALENAVTTMIATGRDDLVAVSLTRVFSLSDLAYLADLLETDLSDGGADTLVVKGAHFLPAVRQRYPVLLEKPPAGDREAIQVTRQIASRALVKESDFRVGFLIMLPDGTAIPGCNVETSDWTRILCAERNALGTAVSYGYRSIEKMYLSTPADYGAMPCGSCRQVLAELVPDRPILIDQGHGLPEATSPEALLPVPFRSPSLKRTHNNS